MRKLLFLIEKDGQPSKTVVLLLLTFVMVSAKYVLGGMTIGHFTFGPFDADGSLTLLGTVSALYFGANNVRLGGAKILTKLLSDQTDQLPDNQAGGQP